MLECSSITSTISSPSTLRSGGGKSSTITVSRMRLGALPGLTSRIIRSCLITLSRLGLRLAISVRRLLRRERGERERRRVTTSSSSYWLLRRKPPPWLRAQKSQRRRRKPTTLPRTMPTTAPGAGPALRPL